VLAEVLTAVVVFALVAIIGTGIGCWLLVRRLGRANRVVPDRRSPAPLTWLWSWRATARLHRRLQRAMRVVAYVMVPFSPPPRGHRPLAQSGPLVDLVGVADALMVRAAELDDRLVSASGLASPWQGKLVGELRTAVAEVEASVSHLERVAVAWRTGIDAAAMWQACPPLDLRSRLGSVEATLAEVAQAAAAGATRAGGPQLR
jgi:hypothetical protein